jgi:hypothetical protein
MLTPRDNSRLSSAFHSVQSSFAGSLVTGVASSLAHIPATVREARAEIQVCLYSVCCCLLQHTVQHSVRNYAAKARCIGFEAQVAYM